MLRPTSVTPIARRACVWGVLGLFVSWGLAGSAQAQSASSTLSSFRTGYSGASLAGLESPVSPSLISSGSQYALSDGVNQSGSAGSLFTSQSLSSQTSGGAGQSSTGVGQGAASSERAPVAVVESTNATGAHATATSTTPSSDMVLNGKLNLDGGQ